MPRKSNFFPPFLILLFLSTLLFVLGRSGVLAGPAGFIAEIASPLERATFKLSGSHEEDSKLQAENKTLIKKLADVQKLTAENSALKDQFETSYPESPNLLPANVISAPSFVPGVTSPEYLVIDKGGKDGVKVGSAVVFRDNLVGKVVEAASSLSKVILVSNSESNFSARTMSVKGVVGEGALGIIRGMGGQDMILDNVLLSESLQPGD
ncbi:MAG: rod shape-determining protein MreC, partial [Candidatus Levyibacteriota bacterium]